MDSSDVSRSHTLIHHPETSASGMKSRGNNDILIDDDLSMRDNKDLSFIDRPEFGMPASQSVLLPNQIVPTPRHMDHLMFYEELLEDDSYDFELIDELFNPKKKFRLSKELVNRNTTSLSNTESNYESNNTN